MQLLPDLLQQVPIARLDFNYAREAISFAFAGGGSDVTASGACDPKRVAPSTWSADCYERDLFLERFVETNGQAIIDGQSYALHLPHLVRVLRAPPEDPADTTFRQGIFAELARDATSRHQFEQIYLAALELRSLLGDSGVGYRLDVNRRRIDILAAIRRLIERMANSFADSNSGLLRIAQFGAAIQRTQGFVRLVQLLSFEDGMAALDARLRIGYDGQLRHFEIVRVTNDEVNPFYSSRLGRLVRRFLMLVRGLRFSDDEVLSRFVDEVFVGVEGELAKIFQLLADMEFYLAGLAFRDRAQQRRLAVCLPRFAFPAPGQGAPRKLVDLFNPLLLDERFVPVPCTIGHARHDDSVVLTGPNSGGKTRLLQALSLAQLLGQSGFFVPARQADLVWAPAMFLSITEHTDPDQKEGRLGMELMRIRRVFESVRAGAFVVVDELCSGTNPGEGEEIFEMVLQLLRELHPQAFISTHFLQFAQRLQAEAARLGISFLQVELDQAHAPTYRFVPGVARSSLAHLTAARLGVTRDELLALVARHKRFAPAGAMQADSEATTRSAGGPTQPVRRTTR